MTACYFFARNLTAKHLYSDIALVADNRSGCSYILDTSCEASRRKSLFVKFFKFICQSKLARSIVWLGLSLLWFFFRRIIIFSKINSLQKSVLVFKRELIKSRCSLLVCSDDRSIVNVIAIRAAQEANIKVVVVVAALPVLNDHLATSRLWSPIYRKPFGRGIYPRGWYHFRGIVLSFYPFWITESLNKLGWIPDNPWIFGTKDGVEAVLVPSKRYAIYLQGRQGVRCPVHALRFPFRDKLGDNEYSKFGENKIVVALPQYFEDAQLSLKASKARLMPLIQKCLDTFSREQVIVSLHPKMIIENYREINDLGVHVIHGHAEELIENAKLLICECSTVIETAVQSRTPVLVLDAFGGGCEIFSSDYLVQVFGSVEDINLAISNMAVLGVRGVSDENTEQTPEADLIEFLQEFI